MRLTDLAIKHLTAGSGRRVFFDDSIKGFGLRVSPSSKTFVLVVHRANRNEWEKLGKYPIVSLADAREAARNRLAVIQLKQESAAPAMTFAEAFELFKQTHTQKKNRARTAKETERLITKHLLPKLRHRDIDDIATHEVMQIVDRLLSKPGTCIHVFAAARLIFRWAYLRRLIPRSPLDGVPAPVESKAGSGRFRTMNFARWSRKPSPTTPHSARLFSSLPLPGNAGRRSDRCEASTFRTA